MKKTLLLIVLLPLFSFGQSFSNFSQSINYSDFIYSGGGGGSATISINNNVLTASFNGGWATGQMRTGVIKYLNITPVISYLELGAIMNNSNSYQTGYFAYIQNNNLIVYTYTYPNTSGFYLNFTKSFILDKIKFTYDAAGNQTQRELCINCSASSAKYSKNPKTLTKEDLIQSEVSDQISYYPNPVKEELYLKWELVNDNTVSSIQVHNLSGQLLQTFQGLEKTDLQTISFQSYPSGVYAVVLLYSNGEQKSIKIIKQ
jgi:hypothetical protein